MPEDATKEETTVSEQQESIVEDNAVENQASESDAFMDDSGDAKDDDHDELYGQQKDEAVETKQEEAQAEKEEETSEEKDDDILRGQELLDAQGETGEKAGKEEKVETRKEEKPFTPPPGMGTDPMQVSHDEDTIKFLAKRIPEKLFPDNVTMPDGTVYDFAQIKQDFPEIPIMVATIADNIVRQLAHGGFDFSNKAISDLRTDMANELFLRDIQAGLPGVKVLDTFNSPDFKKWHDAEPSQIQALFKSNDAEDHVRGFKRFLNAKGMKVADKKVKEIDQARKERKAGVDSILKTTIRGPQKRQTTSALSPRDQEREGFESTELDN